MAVTGTDKGKAEGPAKAAETHVVGVEVGGGGGLGVGGGCREEGMMLAV